MAVSCFAFNKSMSPLSRISAGDVKHYNSQMFMGYIDFQNVYFAFDDTRNYRPYMIFRGQVERLSAIEDVDENGVDRTVRIADKFDNIYFNHNKPEVMYKYEFSDAQLSELAKKGLWTKEGITIPEMFTSRTFMLEMYAEVEEVEPKSMQEIDEDVKKSLAPVLVVDIDRPFSNSFTEQIYELTNFMEKNTASEFDKLEQGADMDRVPMSGYDNAGVMLDALREKQEREAAEAERQKAELQQQLLHDNANVYDTIAKVDERIEKLLSERDAVREAAREKYFEEARAEAEARAAAAANEEKISEDEQRREAIEAAAQKVADKLASKDKVSDKVNVNDLSNQLIFGEASTDDVFGDDDSFFDAFSSNDEAAAAVPVFAENNKKDDDNRGAASNKLNYDVEYHADGTPDDPSGEKKSDGSGSSGGDTGSSDSGSGSANSNVKMNYDLEYNANMDKAPGREGADKIKNDEKQAEGQAEGSETKTETKGSKFEAADAASKNVQNKTEQKAAGTEDSMSK